jgi:hypothetical protein
MPSQRHNIWGLNYMAITSIQTTIDVQKSRVTILFRYHEHQHLLKSKSMLQFTTSYGTIKVASNTNASTWFVNVTFELHSKQSS